MCVLKWRQSVIFHLGCGTVTDSHSHTQLHIYLASNLPNLHVFTLWGKPEYPKKTHINTEDVDYIKYWPPGSAGTQSVGGPSCCEPRVLPTEPHLSTLTVIFAIEYLCFTILYLFLSEIQCSFSL